MSVPATESVTSGLQALLPSSSTASSPDKEMFLQLLVAQLRYQDPMNPADTSEFLSQSAQFTSLEKMQDVADQTALVLGAQMAFGASSLVGRQVTYTLEDGTAGSGSVHGVSFVATGPVLDVDGVQVPLALVQTVTDGTAADPAAPVAPAST
ncbi:MAG: flagellar hook capping protein [Actinobacteria bacterium]|uniref:Unannotated protein n=1 Tax=freshwater metagenome TaxID=449393 RepID=A0A6J6S7T7_9ZZZZ|nr:flagellar hook capping protein [Actinomycetota bacterium]